MKKLFMILCVVIMFFGIVACPGDDSAPLSNQNIHKVITQPNQGSTSNQGTTSNQGITSTTADKITPINDGVNNGTSPVPEPATLILLGSGLVGLAGVGRRKFFKKD